MLKEKCLKKSGMLSYVDLRASIFDILVHNDAPDDLLEALADREREIIGNAGYVAPEILLGKYHAHMQKQRLVQAWNSLQCGYPDTEWKAAVQNFLKKAAT